MQNQGNAAGITTHKQGQTKMKFFADTAEIADIKELAATGLLDGVTTNPSLIAKAGQHRGSAAVTARTGDGSWSSAATISFPQRRCGT